MKNFEKIKQTLLNSANDKEFIAEVMYWVEHWHKGHFRKSGDPYIKHLYETAYQMYLWGFKEDIVAVGLLHDVIEDQDVSADELAQRFGRRIAHMVEGLTKIKKLSNEESQNKLETYRKFFQFLDQKDGLYVLAVKLADRLNNLHDLAPLRKEKRLRIISESLSFYFPLTQRLGAIEVANKILKIYFQNAQVSSFRNIVERTKENYRKSRNQLLRQRKLLERIFRDSKASIFVEPYSLFDIYTRGEENIRKNPFIFRILLDENENPYHFLDFFSSQYHYHIETEDYWRTEKKNGYKGIIGKYLDNALGNIEIRIEPRQHARINQFGFIHILSHNEDPKYQHYLKQYKNAIHQISERLEDVQDPNELYDLLTDAFEEKKIIVITPKNELISLPQNSTALDFAFKIHTDLGKKTKKIFVNDQAVPFNYPLRNGDKVLVEKADTNQITPKWYHWVRTYHARKEIRRFLKGKGSFEESNKKEVQLILNKKQYSEFLAMLPKCKNLLFLEVTNSHESYFIKAQFIEKDSDFSEFLKKFE